MLDVTNLTQAGALSWCLQLLSLSLLIQSVELMCLRRFFAPRGIWRWKTLEPEVQAFPRPVSLLLTPLLGHSGFLALQAGRALAAIALSALTLGSADTPLLPVLLLFLLGASVTTNIRFRGTFNGGSDFMTLIVLTALSAASFSKSPRIATGGLWYIAFHVCASYFVAGWIKLKRANWRSGRALQGFLATAIYDPSAVAAWLQRNRPSALIASWAVMLWEVTFPLSLLDTRACAAYMLPSPGIRERPRTCSSEPEPCPTTYTAPAC